VYRREFAAVAERALRAGQNKVALSFAEIKTRVIEVEELEQNGFGDELFRNLNTGQEWLEAQQKLSAQ
jgi:molybdopterin-guanine dinucleotide biosynthesis protein A